MAQISPGILALVFFVYGLAWFVMGLTVALESRRATALPLASSLKYLAAFGILYSAVPWLDMGLLIGDPGGGSLFLAGGGEQHEGPGAGPEAPLEGRPMRWKKAKSGGSSGVDKKFVVFYRQNALRDTWLA